VQKPVTSLSLQSRGALADPDLAGNIGFGILRQFNITFDYANNVLYFEKNANYGQPTSTTAPACGRAREKVTRSSISWRAARGRGRRQGRDLIVAVNGKAWTSIPLAACGPSSWPRLAPGAVKMDGGAERSSPTRDLI
jgi:hypothetical protein